MLRSRPAEASGCASLVGATVFHGVSRRQSSLEVTDREFARRLGQVTNAGGAAPDVDLLIRTGGERRLSDFMLWESAYAELHFTPRMWPEFDVTDLEAAVDDYFSRERRFGRLPDAAAAS